jgi:serine/threonine protein kinase
MAPERATGEDSGPAADLWALGATLYCAVEGHPPFERDEPMATLMAVVQEDPPRPVRAGPLEPALAGLLTRDPAQRSSPARARADLQAALAGGPAPPRAHGPVPPRPAPPRPAPPRPEARRPLRPSVAVIGAEDLRSLAASSRAALGAAVGNARSSARDQAAARRQRAVDRRSGFGRRLTRRLVALALTAVLLVVLLVVGAALLVAHEAGAF